MINTLFRQTLGSLIQRQLARSKTTSLQSALATCVMIAGINGGIANALTLTPAAAAAGWTLTVFANGFTADANNLGPLGIAFRDDGGVIVTDTFGNVRVFPNDADGQNAQNAPIGQNYHGFNTVGLARVGKSFYMCEYNNHQLAQINADGTFNQLIVDGGATNLFTGLTVNPNNGHLFIASQYPKAYIHEVDPGAKTAAVFLTLPPGFAGADGLTTDGTTLYVESGGHILGFRISDQKWIFDSGYLLGADGCAVGSGSLAGSLFVNTNYGQVFQIDLATQVITLITTGGSRGDFVTVDPNGTLLVTQSSWIARLTPPPGESFETASVTVKPSTVAGSTNATGTVTLGVPAPINLAVSLSSNNAAIQVPTSIIVPAGSLTASFPIATTAVSTTTSGQIIATLNGISSTATLKVRPIGVLSLMLTPTTIKGGNTATGTVTLEGAAAPASITVTFTSSDTAIVPTPAPITISAGQKSATFTVTTTKVTAKTKVTISATANNITSPAKLTVTP